MVGASAAAPGWHCHSNPVPQVLLSKDSSIVCDGSSSAQGHVWWQVFHTVPKPVFWRLNKPAGKLVFRVTTARAGGAGLQQVPPEALARTERLQSGPCRWPDQLLLLCLSLGPAEEQRRAGSVLCVGMRSAMRCVSSPLPVAGCEAPRCPGAFTGSLPAVQTGSSCPALTNSPATRSAWAGGELGRLPVARGTPEALAGAGGDAQEPGTTLPAPRAGGALQGMAPASPEPGAPRGRHGGPSRALPAGPRSSRPRPVSGGRPSSGTPPGGGDGGRGGGGMAGVRRAR